MILGILKKNYQMFFYHTQQYNGNCDLVWCKFLRLTASSNKGSSMTYMEYQVCVFTHDQCLEYLVFSLSFLPFDYQRLTLT